MWIMNMGQRQGHQCKNLVQKERTCEADREDHTLLLVNWRQPEDSGVPVVLLVSQPATSQAAAGFTPR